MKNRKQIRIPSILTYAGTLVRLFLFSCVIALAFHMATDGVFDPVAATKDGGRIFLFIAALQIVAGYMRLQVAPKGSLRDDSLVVNDTTYAGTFAPYFLLPALYGMDSYEKGVLYLKDGIKKTHTIGTMDFSNPLQARAVTPTTSGGDITIDKRTLTPYDVMVYQEFNPRDLEVHWTAEDLSTTLLTRQLPPSVENYMMLLITQRAFEQYENGIWMGSTTYAAATGSTGNGQLKFFDGLLKKMIADSNVYQTASPVTITASNIQAKLQDLYAAAATNNKALLLKSTKYQRMKFLVSLNTDLLYEEYITTNTTYKNNNTTEKGIRQYKGFEIIPVAGMPDNTIVFTEALSSTEGNLWLGMNSISDEQLQLMRLQNNSELFFFKMLMKMDVNYGLANKIFLYTTLTSSSFTA